jgi:hypothetical protein
MSSAQGRFAWLVLGVSAVAALAVALLVEGARDDAAVSLAAGFVLAAAAVLGIVLLARIVVRAERRDERG